MTRHEAGSLGENRASRRAPWSGTHVSLEVDREGRILSSRPRALDPFGRRASDVVGKYASDLFAADDMLTARALVHRANRDGSAEPIRLRFRGGDDSEIVARVSAHRIGAKLNVRIRACDDAEQETYRADAGRRARFDALTSLPNRLLLLERSQTALRAGACALALLDIDRFRQLCSGVGTRIGDRILVEVGDRLIAAGGSDGIVGLWGGQFAVLVPSRRTPDEVGALIARIHDAVTAPFAANGEPIELSACLGVATAPRAQTRSDSSPTPRSRLQRRSRSATRVAPYSIPPSGAAPFVRWNCRAISPEPLTATSSASSSNRSWSSKPKRSWGTRLSSGGNTPIEDCSHPVTSSGSRNARARARPSTTGCSSTPAVKVPTGHAAGT